MNGSRSRHTGTRLLSNAYGRIALLRRAWYTRPGRRRRLHHRVISVGNLTVGGSGKTPVVAALARLLRARGERPVILTRGYARRDVTEGVLVVSDGSRVRAPVARSGDEPQMLARTLPGVPVLVCADRYVAGLFAEKQFDPTVSILDDGFQHVQLERDIDLLLIAPEDVRDHVLPCGRLREPLTAAALADAVLVAGTDDEVGAVASSVGHRVAFRIETHYGPLSHISATPDTHGRLLAFAGIARPERFFGALRSLGYDVVRELTFPDHHWYTQRDLERIQSVAKAVDAAILVTTEKDAVRCDLDVAVLPLSVSVEPSAAFESWLMGRLR